MTENPVLRLRLRFAVEPLLHEVLESVAEFPAQAVRQVVPAAVGFEDSAAELPCDPERRHVRSDAEHAAGRTVRNPGGAALSAREQVDPVDLFCEESACFKLHHQPVAFRDDRLRLSGPLVVQAVAEV